MIGSICPVYRLLVSKWIAVVEGWMWCNGCNILKVQLRKKKEGDVSGHTPLVKLLVRPV